MTTVNTMALVQPYVRDSESPPLTKTMIELTIVPKKGREVWRVKRVNGNSATSEARFKLAADMFSRTFSQRPPSLQLPVMQYSCNIHHYGPLRIEFFSPH